MTFQEYQNWAVTTKIYDESIALPYVVLGLSGEAGEVSEKIKKYLRDDFNSFKAGIVSENLKTELIKELGDVLWYLAAASDELGTNLEEIAQKNVEKLNSRQERNALAGSGDNR